MVLPEAFILRTQAILRDEWNEFEQALKAESPTSIRLNPAKMAGFSYGPVISWTSNAYYLDSRPSFTLDPLFHAGCYYVQEASSMFLEQMIKKQVTQPVKVLDLCAAPGGKSTQLSAVLPEGSLLAANEVIRPRAAVLVENLTKWGNPHTMVMNNDPAVFGKLTGFFDVLVTDVPCSGEGMFRKNPDAIQEWSVNNVQLCAERQRRIVEDSWPALKPGGLLIYSTCTYNKEENEENIDWICRELGAELTETPHRFWPHKTKGEGFFIAAVRKTGKEKESVIAGLTRHPKSTVNHGMAGQARNDRGVYRGMEEWILHPEDFVIFQDNNFIKAVPKIHWADYTLLLKHLKILSAGITLCEIKGKDRIPDHSLAMSNELAMNAFPAWELDKETALKYLRKEALQTIPGDLPKGYVLLTYSGHPLGFVKNIGNRANNLYPQHWRIRF
ncbi:rRNA cytosine-C5-methyltransferase [Bacteroidia bacterium]|nr:rRNA cytosine-C5-methyltransferase [Bacteroidia bacterium]